MGDKMKAKLEWAVLLVGILGTLLNVGISIGMQKATNETIKEWRTAKDSCDAKQDEEIHGIDNRVTRAETKIEMHHKAN